MPNLTPEEIKAMSQPLHTPGEKNQEYGHRGKITAAAIHSEKVAVEAEAWVEEHAEGNTDDAVRP
jgi:hypothetical protein